MRKEKKYNYLYKTTCSLTKRFYYGMHSTDVLDDGYLGSGSELSRSIKKYGKENHYKEILSFYKTRKELKKAEANLITESIIHNPMCMNLSLGGGGTNYLKGLITVKDKEGNTFSVSIDDPRYLSGELVHILKDMINVRDRKGNILKVSIDDPRYLSGELIHINKGMITVKDRKGNKFNVPKDDPRYLSGELVGVAKETITVKDKEGNIFNVSKDDPRYLSGKLKFIWEGKKHKEETKKKIGLANSIKQKGKGNSQYGTMWITNGRENKKIKKEDKIPKGWYKGRKII